MPWGISQMAVRADRLSAPASTAAIALVLSLSGVAQGQNTPSTPASTPVSTCTPLPQTATPTPTVAPGGVLGELDQLFISTYAARRTKVAATTHPVIVVSGSNLILRRYEGDKSKPEKVIPGIYHALKAIAHAPFTLYLALSPETGSNSLSLELRDRLGSLQQSVSKAESSLATSGFATAQRSRQQRILDACSSLISETLGIDHVTRDRLAAFAAGMGPMILANAAEAGCAQVQATHAQVMKWKALMTADEWAHLRVAVRGKHQARYRNAATQYFAWLLKDRGPVWAYPGESMRVVYAEFLGRDEDSQDLLAAVLIDGAASRAFFGNQWRLTEDILSRGANRCVARLAASGTAGR